MDELESGVDQGVWARSDTWLPEGGKGAPTGVSPPLQGSLTQGGMESKEKNRGMGWLLALQEDSWFKVGFVMGFL